MLDILRYSGAQIWCAPIGTPLPPTPLAQSIDGGPANWASAITSTSTQPLTDTCATIFAA